MKAPSDFLRGFLIGILSKRVRLLLGIHQLSINSFYFTFFKRGISIKIGLRLQETDHKMYQGGEGKYEFHFNIYSPELKLKGKSCSWEKL